MALGIRYAVDEGARILNVSVNSDGTNTSLEDALRYAGERGATVVASAGNDSRNIDLRPSYPAASAQPAVLSATASEREGGLWWSANRGLRSVDIAAPGTGILSTARGSHYEVRDGTSMAAPFVAGSLALLSAARPDLPQSALRAALLKSAPRPGLLAGLLGSGRLDVASALHRVLPGALWRKDAIASAADARVRVRTAARVRAGRAATVRWTASGADEIVRWRVLLDDRRIRTLPAGSARVVRARMRSAGTHRWKIVGVDASGTRVVSAARSFRVLPRR